MAKPKWALTESQKKGTISDTQFENKFIKKDVENKYLPPYASRTGAVQKSALDSLPRMFKDYDPDSDKPSWFGAQLERNATEKLIKKYYDRLQAEKNNLKAPDVNEWGNENDPNYQRLLGQYLEKQALSNLSFEDYRKYMYQNEMNPKWKPSMKDDFLYPSYSGKERVSNDENLPGAFKLVNRVLGQAANTIVGDNAVKTSGTGNKYIDTAASIGGTILGLATPIPGTQGASILSGGTKLGQVGVNKLANINTANKYLKLIPKAANNKVGRALIEGAIAGAPIDAWESIKNKDSAGEVLKNVGEGALIGAGADLGLMGLSKGLKALKNSAVRETVEESSMGLKKGKGRFRTPEMLRKAEESKALNEYLDDLEYRDYINSLDPEYIKAENAYRAKQGLPPLDDRAVKSSVIIKKERTPAPKTIEKPSVVMKKERLTPEQLYLRDFAQKNNVSIDDMIEETKGNIEAVKRKHVDYLKNSGGRGVNREIMTIYDDLGRQQGKRAVMVSENPGWYSDFYKANGRKPTQRDLEELAEEHLTNGFNDISGEVPTNEEYLSLKKQLNDLETIKNSKGNYSNTMDFKGIETLRNPVQKGSFDNKIIKSSSYVQERVETPKVTKPVEIEPPKIKSSTVQSKVESSSINIKPPKITRTQPKIETPKIEAAATVEPKGVESSVKFVSSSKGKKKTFKETLDNFYTRFVDTNHPLKKIGDETHIKATNSKNAGGTVSYVMKDKLVDMEGKEIGKSLKETIEAIPKGKEDDFWNYMGHRHNIDRAREGKNVFPDFTSEQSLKAMQDIEKANPEFKKAADDVVKFINDFMEEWGHKSGLIDDDTWKKLRETYPNYFPTHRSFDELEDGIRNAFTNSKGFVDQTTPLKKATGSERNIVNPVENIMSLVNSTIRKARYNQVGQSLADSIRKAPDKLRAFAEIVPENSTAKNVVTILENGKPTYIRINDKNLLNALEGMYKYTDGDVERVVRGLTNKFKALITQKNPIFTVRNFFRDLPTAYIYGSEKNPLKFGKEYFGAVKDLSRNTDVARQFKALGGMSSNFSFDSSNIAKSVDDLLKKEGVLTKIEKINNIVEAAPRLAEFKRVFEKTGDLDRALNAAADVTTNFSRSGDITKKIDAGVPYLNAGVQGLDKLARQLNPKNPKQLMETLVKGGLSIALPSFALHMINKDNENYKMLDNRTKDNYYLIPSGDTFIKIPKSRELGVLFGVLTERTMRALNGEDKAFKGLVGTIGTNFSPANPVEDNILAPLAINIPRNKDFAGRTIVPANMTDRSPEYQYDEQTSEIAKAIGKLTKKSPKQVDYLIRSYTGIIGQLLIPAATKTTYQGGTTLEKITRPITSQFTADPLYNNNAISEFYENYDNLKTKAADKNFVDNIPSKTVTKEESLRNQFTKASKEISDLNKQIKEAEKRGDRAKVRELRLKMIDIAQKSNRLMK